MTTSDKDRLGRLGSGESIEALCDADGIDRAEFDRWWSETIRQRVHLATGSLPADVSAEVSIQRDKHGIPHIYATTDRDLFFGYGWAMAEDRLFQLDWLRRKGLGRLSEIIGTDGLELDTVARTVGLNRIATAEWERLPGEVQHLPEAFSDGINAVMAGCGDNLPVEFDLLQYRPEPWSPVDCLAIEVEFRWYLTGRFPVICMPELAKRKLGEGPLLREYLLGEEDNESILLSGDYEPLIGQPLEPVGESVADPDASTGSNNWVISGRRTTTGAPLLASDPHIAFEAVSCWYEAHLNGGSFNVAGMTYVGMPAIMFGRNEQVAWGITNNICSLRDLYQERLSDQHPGCFEYDGQWEPARELTETIAVRDADDVVCRVRFSRNGPIVDDILPAPANELGPVSLNWLGMSQGGWLTSLLGMDRAANVAELRDAMRPWHVPTFGLVLADSAGGIGFHASGRIPIRKRSERAFRCGWDPEDQWQGLIPFDEMPSFVNPDRGWIASANNRIAPDDFPHRMYGCWVSGFRGQRIREMIESRESVSADDMRDMQQDALNLRAAKLVPILIRELDSAESQSIAILSSWNGVSTPESVAATLFNVFYSHWCETVSNARFTGVTAELLAKGVDPCATRLLESDPHGWFPDGSRQQQIRDTFAATLAYLQDRFGPDMTGWTWSQLHVMPLRHVLSSRGDLGKLLDHGGASVRGDMLTVCNTGCGSDWTANTGAGYRMVADLSSSPPVLRAVDAQSQSGQPGSPHYSDQFDDWVSGRYHEIELTNDVDARSTLILTPFN
ncbi:MAG: penicillin acylase family protein [Planctomycetota bacterium]|nr:penicillin acylase family protein [Planctomycetota bacterium]